MKRRREGRKEEGKKKKKRERKEREPETKKDQEGPKRAAPGGFRSGARLIGPPGGWAGLESVLILPPLWLLAGRSAQHDGVPDS